MASIEAVFARQILDSRGNPTVEVEVILDDGTLGRAAAPSGASTGAFEAVELRDGDGELRRQGGHPGGQGVIEEIQPTLLGYDADDQRLIDQAMIDLDRTPDKSRLGANAIVARQHGRREGRRRVGRACRCSATSADPTRTCCRCR